MAGNEDRTEKPTPKRKKEARKEGRVAKSPDVAAWLIMLVGSMLLPVFFRSASKRMEQLMAQSMTVVSNPSPVGALAVLDKGLTDVLDVVLPMVGAFAVVGVVANVAQTGLVLSLHAAAPKWNKLNPITGIKNIFSTGSLWQLGKQMVKLLALVGIAYSAVSGLFHSLVGNQSAGLGATVALSTQSITGMVRDVAVVGLVLAVADFVWQKRKLNKSLKMTKQEVKEEAKQSDGNPVIRGEIRKKMYRMSRMRMMAAVAGADVIVVNPTHYAVALRYDPLRRGAPVVVAKGTDDLAIRIREEGCKHKVPVVEDPPLARAIHASCEIEDVIPPELFMAVARLLAFVFTLSPIVRAAGLVHRRPTSALVA